MKRAVKRFLSAALAFGLVLGTMEYVPAVKAQAAGGANLIQNPDFAQDDMSMWMDTGATITIESQDTEICEGVKTYATISSRTQSYQGFSQDVTDVVVPGKEYEISYYIRLSEDYEGLAASQREAFFGPFVVSGGETKYLSQTYTGEISGNLLQQIPVGEWVQMSGTWTVDEDADQVVVRFQEESSKNMGSYSITAVSMKEAGAAVTTAPEPQTQSDGMPILKEAITAALGEDTIVGMVTHPANNKKEWALLTQHANAVTTGNELKPDCHFGYSNGRCPGTETITFQGKSMLVPKIDYSRSEKFLNAVLKYNEEHPDNFIKVRGHVLVWHAQTPEWFFHEEYDPKKDYVSKEEMDRRLEWYISTLFEHYLGENSKYKDLFYGWDVVNEACADSTAQVYRDDKGGNDKLTDATHNNKSSWWHIYQSNEYIINAFKYANKYAPANVELYYNDYNEIWDVKVPNIAQCLKDIKAQEGAPGVGTRIDAYGMQAHYSLGDFNVQNFEKAARTYLDIVGKVQLTELDMKASANYDGTEASKDQEYQDQAFCYMSIFETLKKLDAEPGYEIGGITFWGVTDPTSWLQSANDVGGGSDGLRSQCPLLFDGNYEAKPSFWAFVDPTKIAVAQKKITVRRVYDGKFKDGESYTLSSGDTSATIIPVWDETGMKIQVEVKDASIDKENDCVTVYLDEESRGAEGITPTIIKIKRGEGSSIGGGYKTTFKIPLSEITIGKQMRLDITVTDGDKVIAYNDIQGTQENSSANYALATLTPALTRVPQGTAAVDGEKEEIWNTAETFWLNTGNGNPAAAAKVKVLWDIDKLYVYAEIQDGAVSDQDGLEIYIDEDHAGGGSYAKDDKRYSISAENVLTCSGKKASEKNVESIVKKTETGYVVEASFAWTNTTQKVHNLVGFDLKVRDADAAGKDNGMLAWFDATGEAENSPSCFGTIKLAAKSDAKEETENPDAAFAMVKTPVISEESAVEGPAAGQEQEETEPGEGKEENSSKQGGMTATVLIILAGIAAIAAFAGLRRTGKKTAGENAAEKKENTDQ